MAMEFLLFSQLMFQATIVDDSYNSPGAIGFIITFAVAVGSVALFFDMIVDMGLDDVEDLKSEDYSCRVIVKAMDKLNLLRTVPVSMWATCEERPSSLRNDADWALFTKLLGIPS